MMNSCDPMGSSEAFSAHYGCEKEPKRQRGSCVGETQVWVFSGRRSVHNIIVFLSSVILFSAITRRPE